MLQFEEVKQSLTDLEPELRDLADALGLEKTKEEIEKLEQEAAAPGFWDHPENTQKVLQRTSGLKNKVESYEKLCRQFDDAMALAEAGHSAEEIRTILEEQKLQASIYISLETLKYLKKGGRITPAAAAIGTVLNLKPVLQIQGEKLDAYAKVRGKKAARRTMIEAIQKDLKNRFAEPLAQGRMGFGIAYSGNLEEALDWKAELEAAFPGVDFQMDPLSLSVACHIAYGALACGCYVKAI